MAFKDKSNHAVKFYYRVDAAYKKAAKGRKLVHVNDFNLFVVKNYGVIFR